MSEKLMHQSLPLRTSSASLFLLILFFAAGANAGTSITAPFTQADCDNGAATLDLRSQADVDGFPCTAVKGDIFITPRAPGSPNGGPINSLAGLTNLTRIDGQLRIVFYSGNAPATLAGLENVTHLGSLRIESNISNAPDDLKDISALGGLTSIGPRSCTSTTGVCQTSIAISSSDITQLPAWNIASATTLETLSIVGLPLIDPATLKDLPVPSLLLFLEDLPLDTSQVSQFEALKRLGIQAQDDVRFENMPKVTTLPIQPMVRNLALDRLGLLDLSNLTTANYPALQNLRLSGLNGIDGSELATVRDFNTLTLQEMDGLSGGQPLAGLTGGTFKRLVLKQLSNVSTLTDLTSVTSLEQLEVANLNLLTSLDGLQNLAAVSKLLDISENSMLLNIDELAKLKSITGELKIQQNSALMNLDGLRNLTGTVTDILIFQDTQLTDIKGLAGIQGVSRNLYVGQNNVTECDVLVAGRLSPQPQSYRVDPQCIYLAPMLASSANALDFGSGAIGSIIDRSITLENSTGTISTTVDISALTISGDALGEYSIQSENCTSNPLTGGSSRSSCTITVRFTVDQIGVDNAQLNISYTTSDNSSSQSLPVSLTAAGTGVSGDQLIPNTNLDFGKVELAGSKTDTITIDNTGGSGALTVSAISASGDFAISSNSCGNTYPQTVAVGTTCLVSVEFAPSTLSALAGTFTMTSDAATSPDNVNLLGEGVPAPAPEPAPTSLNFGDVIIGTSSTQQILTVRNIGPLRGLPLGQLSVSGDFTLQALSGQCSGATLAPAGQAGSACAVAVLYNPTTTGPATGTIDIPGASGFPSASVSLAGNGLQSASLTASPTHIAFGTQTVPTTMSVTVTNIGAIGQDAQIGTATITGTQSPLQFAVDTDSCSGTTLAGQATCQVTLQFDPSQDGADTGTLELTYNSGQTLIVALSGRGGEPVDYINPANLSFTEEVGNVSVAQTVTVTDNSGIALDVAKVSSLDSQFSVSNDTCSGTTVNPGGNCTFDVAFTATAPGHVVSTIEVVSNSASSPDHVIVDGIGQKPGELQLSEATFDFGAIPPGQSGNETVTVTNIGDADFPVGPVTLTGDSAFTLTSDSCSGVTLAAAATCSFAVNFAPAAAGDVVAQVDVNPTLFLAGSGQSPVAAPKPVPTLPNLLWVLVALIGVMGATRLRRL
ncbi:MAG: choice-of-anchor D domain-containing protein [Halioglobus sp.]